MEKSSSSDKFEMINRDDEKAEKLEKDEKKEGESTDSFNLRLPFPLFECNPRHCLTGLVR